MAKLPAISAQQRLQIATGKRPGGQAVTIEKIAQVLHVSTDYLLGLKENDGEHQAKA